MRLLIAYDGSPCAESALDDIANIGLPVTGEAMVVSVAETWLPPPGQQLVISNETDAYVEAIVSKHRIKAEHRLHEADTIASHGASRVRNTLPKWSVRKQSTFGSPAWQILEAADEFKPELILLGSHGRSTLGRLILGSVSQKVLTEAECSVRIARGRVEVESGGQRILIGFDGSAGSMAAVDSVASRSWRPGTEVRLVSATDSSVPSIVGRFVMPDPRLINENQGGEYDWLRRMADDAKALLEKKEFSVFMTMLPGNPKEILISEAEKWHADSIFLGANAAGTRIERFLLGTTSSAVAARAHCSVEVVRCGKRTLAQASIQN